MTLNSWNKIWKNRTYCVKNEPSNNINYFYNYHLKKSRKNQRYSIVGVEMEEILIFINRIYIY